jgi:hypothetical protein
MRYYLYIFTLMDLGRCPDGRKMAKCGYCQRLVKAYPLNKRNYENTI